MANRYVLDASKPYKYWMHFFYSFRRAHVNSFFQEEIKIMIYCPYLNIRCEGSFFPACIVLRPFNLYEIFKVFFVYFILIFFFFAFF